MVRQMAGCLDGTAAPDTPFQELLVRALENLKTLDYIGFQQTLDADFHALTRKGGFPQLPLPKENITKTLANSSGSSYNASANKQDILARAAARIKWDMDFYQKALALAETINSKPYKNKG